MSQYDKRGIAEDHIEPLCKPMGLHLNSLKELNTSNIQAFNTFTPNLQNIQVILAI